MIVKRLGTEESPSSLSFTASSQSMSTELAKEDVVGSQVINLLQQISRLRTTNLGAKDKVDFLKYYWERKNGRSRRVY